jgi:hypothetical protein
VVLLGATQTMSKDDLKINLKDIKIRKKFTRDPSEKIELPAKGSPYNRAQAKRAWQEDLEEELEDLDF